MAEKQEAGRRVNLGILCGLGFLVGVVTGFGAVVFRALIGLIHNIFFLGTFTFHYDSSIFTPRGPWGPAIILAPVIGGMGVVWLVKTFAPEAKGHGVPEVMDAIFYGEGRIRPVVAVIKSLASALSIGSGAAIGREGPIIQIGSAFGSTLGQVLRIATWQRVTMVAAGAGAGIAATFNTPLGGVMFAVELMMPEVSTRTFLPVVIATGVATYIGRLFFGLQPAFVVPIIDVPKLQPIDPIVIVAFVILGVLCGFASWAFVRLLTFMEFTFEGMPINAYAQHALGMLIVGVMMYVLMVTTGHYYVEGVGYATIQDILQGNLTLVYLLAILFFAKLFATTLSLGSGASGGIFSPSLFMGATLGGAFGALAPYIGLLPAGFGIPEFAMVGMASIVGGATGAAMTAIVMIFEMTRDYNIMVPMIIAVAISIGVRRVLSPENIYTIKLAWRGRRIPKDRHSNMFLIRHAREVMSPRIAVLPADILVHDALKQLRDGERKTHVVVARKKHIVGVVPLTEGLLSLEEVRANVTLADIAERNYIVAPPDQIMFDTFPRLIRRNASHVLVVDKGGVPRADQVIGIVSKEHIADAVLSNFGSFG